MSGPFDPYGSDGGGEATVGFHAPYSDVMDPINWAAVVIAAVLAAAVLWLVGRRQGRGRGDWICLLQIVPAAMLGHALARIGADKLVEKPQLYAMQSAGLALAIVIPALWIVQTRDGVSARAIGRDSAAFLLAYLVMGAVFWAMA